MEKIKKFLDDYDIKNKTVILGFSAGPDSCYLAYFINKLKSVYNLNPILAYFNHGWRKEAKKEEEFTKNFAKKLNFGCEIGYAPKDYKKTEEIARQYRYEFLYETANKYNCDVVLLGHNKNDNIETLLYRIIKGTSILGLKSIPKKREIFYRPMLDITKEEILDTLDKKNIAFLVDASNEDTKYKRNLIRKKIFPYLKEINPNFIENMNILIENAINSNKIIDDTLEKIKKEIIKENEIIFDKFIELENPYRLAILNDFLGDKLKYRDNKTLKKLDGLILKNEKRSSINSDICLAIKKNKIFLEKKTIINVKSKNPNQKDLQRIKWVKLKES